MKIPENEPNLSTIYAGSNVGEMNSTEIELKTARDDANAP